MTRLRYSSAGVTLVELAVVLVLLTIVAGITLQGAGLLQGALGSGRAKGAGDDIVQAVRYARQRFHAYAGNLCRIILARLARSLGCQ